MNLHEYQAKQLLAKYGLPIPNGYICTTHQEAREVICKIGAGPWAVKCQLHAGGRYKAGGVKIVNSKEDLCTFAEKWFGKRLVTYQTNPEGLPVHKILVEKVTNINKELYLGAIIDHSAYRIVFIGSPTGGVNIEKVAQSTPTRIFKIAIDPLIGPQPCQGRELALKLGLISKQVSQFVKIFIGLATLFLERDLAMLEINPLVITKEGDLECLDVKIKVDSNALFRQPELSKLRDLSQEDERESRALKCNLNYVSLDGNIGCMVNGAGLAMGTIDLINLYGGKAANFLDIGGRVTKEHVMEAFKIILSNDKVKVVLVNVFGGIVRCDIIVDSIIGAVAAVGINIPVVVRLEGNNAELGIKKLGATFINIITANSLIDATQKVVAAAESK